MNYKQAKAQGLVAYESGVKIRDNPFPASSGLYMAWLRGWMGERDNAAKEAEDMARPPISPPLPSLLLTARRAMSIHVHVTARRQAL